MAARKYQFFLILATLPSKPSVRAWLVFSVPLVCAAKTIIMIMPPSMAIPSALRVTVLEPIAKDPQRLNTK